MAESGFNDVDAAVWFGFVAPAKTPKDIADKLQRAVVDVLKEDEVQKRLSDLGAQAVGSTPEEFATFLKKEDAKWGEVVRKGDIKLD